MTKTEAIKTVPSPEVKEPQDGAPKKRARHTADYKLRILKEADLLKSQPGAIGALLRREGLYSSLLSEWRKQRDSGSLSALSIKRGRKPKMSAQDLAMARLEKENQRLQERLRQADLIIEAQKKISEILGLSASLTSSEGEQL